jgi:hypothetical protein
VIIRDEFSQVIADIIGSAHDDHFSDSVPDYGDLNEAFWYELWFPYRYPKKPFDSL